MLSNSARALITRTLEDVTVRECKVVQLQSCSMQLSDYVTLRPYDSLCISNYFETIPPLLVLTHYNGCAGSVQEHIVPRGE